jgi:hypothetical protein
MSTNSILNGLGREVTGTKNGGQLATVMFFQSGFGCFGQNAVFQVGCFFDEAVREGCLLTQAGRLGASAPTDGCFNLVGRRSMEPRMMGMERIWKIAGRASRRVNSDGALETKRPTSCAVMPEIISRRPSVCIGEIRGYLRGIVSEKGGSKWVGFPLLYFSNGFESPNRNFLAILFPFRRLSRIDCNN